MDELKIPERIEGVRLWLRLVEPHDAPYICALRTNPAYNAHLSPVAGSVEDQRRWIEAYKEREQQGTEAYYIIERLSDGVPCGTVRLYDILRNDQFTWGSWILDHNKPSKAALESAVLVYDVGFFSLRCSKAVFDVRKENEKTLNFHRRLGAIQNGEDDLNIYFTYPRERFLADRDQYMAILREGA